MVQKFGKAVVKARFVILVLALVLLIPSAWGTLHTRINYDLLTYLPESIETIRGQNILTDDFGTGAITMLVIEGKSDREIVAIKERIEQVEHVNKVIWYDSVMDISVPKELLPDKLLKAFVNGDATLMAVTYDSSTSSDDTMDAITEIRKGLDDGAYLQGMSAVVTDTRDVAEAEEPIYVLIAVVLSSIVLALSMDTFLAPVFFLLSIGVAILYNLGTNYFFGEISYLTKALAAVLQLGVTMDYSIFLYHSFKEEETLHPDDEKGAMAEAIARTLQSVVGSSVTTIAGFAALCFMTFRFGFDVGIVMMKGVALGVVCCVTVLPSMILIFNGAIEKTRHRPFLPEFRKIPGLVQKHYRLILVLFCLVWIPAGFGYTHTAVYYDLLDTLPQDLPSMQANKKLDESFSMNNTLMILADSQLDNKSVTRMCDEIRGVDGVKNVIGLETYLGETIPEEMIPQDLRDELTTDEYQLLLVGSEYKTATDEVNAQIDEINQIMDRYDEKAMLIGDAPCTRDLINISNRDFNVVNWVSIAFIFCIVAVVFGSLSLPFILVLVIECAIFINMAIPYYTGVSLPFIASIVIGTIQLGSTVDYAVLMTSRYQQERRSGKSREESVRIAHSTSMTSVIVSAMSFFAATIGVSVYSRISIISSLCTLMARGALISMATVLLVLPAALLLLDPLILRTSRGFLPEGARKNKKNTTDNNERRHGETQPV